jgi:predicted PurR-regulated permease PerM
MADLEKFDMFKFGGLVNQVENLQHKVDSMDKDIKELLELANKSKGGFWMGMTIASIVGGVITYISSWVFHK